MKIRVMPNDFHRSILNHFVWLAFRQRPLYLHVQGKNQEQVNSKLESFFLLHSFKHMLETYWCAKVLDMSHVMSKPLFICIIRGCDEN